MQSMPNTTSEPREVLEIAPDVVLVARAAADFPSLAPDAAGQHFDRQPHPGSVFAAVQAPEVDATFRASDVNKAVRPSRGRWMRTAAVAFLLAFGSAFATAAWERYGDKARAMVMDLAPRMPDFSSWLPSQHEAGTTQPVAATAPIAPATNSAPPPQDIAMLQSMSRDVANLTQQIGELKASIAQLKAAQEQLSHDMTGRIADARPAEPKPAEPRPKQLGAPPRPLGTIVQHKPKPVAYPPAQAAVAPMQVPAAAPSPVQLAPVQPEGDPAVRPPVPVR